MTVDGTSAENTTKPNKQNAPDNAYNSWVLRMWQEESQGTWRASLKDVRDGRQTNFSSFTSLVAFLEAGGMKG